MENIKSVLTTFYLKCLTVNPESNAAEILSNILSEEFISYGSVDSKTKSQLIGQISFFWKLIPDLKWEPQDIIIQGNKAVVRSIASGTPNGDFMGIPTDGTKSFKTMTIDIHRIVNGKISTVHHLEDWVTALKQLKEK